MTREKLSQVLDNYEEMLNLIEENDNRLEHISEMIHGMRILIRENYGTHKDGLMRRLGFIQGVLWCIGIFTIDDLRYHNLSGEIE